MPGSPATASIGVEEEFQIVDPETRQLRQRAGRILPGAKQVAGDEVSNELFLSQIEIGTPVCQTLGEVRAELIRLRKAVIEAAASEGCRIASTATHPFSRWEDQRLTPKERYDTILEEFQQLTREQIICGCHVHVGIDDPGLTIQVLNRVRPWLAPILALSANSPFWLGRDTGYASYRTELFGRFPMTGMPGDFADRAEYDRVVASLVATGTIGDASKLYWDVRPSMHFPTLEFRVADVCQDLDEAVLIAGLCRGLAITCARAASSGDPAPEVRPELLKAARWRAARFGLDGELIDLRAERLVPAADLIEKFLTFLRPALEGSGDWPEVSALARRTLERGNGAARQREAYRRSGRFEDVVDRIIVETHRGVV